MQTVYLSIGSNIDRERYVAIAIRELRRRFGDLRISPVYESEAVGFAGDDFYNLAIGLTTAMAFAELVGELKALEYRHGRAVDTPKFAPRTLDIDILTFGDWVGEFSGVVLPRPEITENAFVLRPLQDIAGEDLHPALGVSYAELWRGFDQRSQRLWPAALDPARLVDAGT